MKQVPFISLLGVPWDEHSSYAAGPAGAPAAIREALFSDSTNLWTEAGYNLSDGTLFRDCGDMDLRVPVNAQSISTAVAELVADLTLPLCLGGDHAVTYPIVRGIDKVYDRLAIVHFDAHPDLYDIFNNNRFSNACPFARIMEENLAARLVQIGIRTANAHQREQADRFTVEMIEMAQIETAPDHLHFDVPIFISFDMDVLDPAFAPGVSHPEPGGLSTRQAITLIQSIHAPSVAGIDLVEYNPRQDYKRITAYTAAKILKELAARALYLAGIRPKAS